MSGDLHQLLLCLETRSMFLLMITLVIRFTWWNLIPSYTKFIKNSMLGFLLVFLGEYKYSFLILLGYTWLRIIWYYLWNILLLFPLTDWYPGKKSILTSMYSLVRCLPVFLVMNSSFSMICFKNFLIILDCVNWLCLVYFSPKEWKTDIQ